MTGMSVQRTTSHAPRPFKPVVASINAPAAPPAPAAPATGQVAAPPAQALPATGPVQAYRDSDYLTWRAGADRDIAQQRGQLDNEETSDNVARAEAIRRMMTQRPEDLHAADVGANKSGLFYSGQLGKQRGQIEADYVRRQADTNAEYDQRKAARDVARRALEAGYTAEDAAQMAAAADRAVGRDSDYATLNALTSNADPAVARPAGVAPAAAARPRPTGAEAAAAAARDRARAQRERAVALARARARARRK